MIDLYNSRMTSSRPTANTEEATQSDDLSALIQMALGYPLDDETFAALFAIQRELWNNKNNLAMRLQNGQLRPEDYLSQLNEMIKLAMDQSCRLLGDERFQQIFGEPGRFPEGLVNPEIFLLHNPTVEGRSATNPRAIPANERLTRPSSWSIRIDQRDDQITFTPDVPGAKTGQPLGVNSADNVTWNNLTNLEITLKSMPEGDLLCDPIPAGQGSKPFFKVTRTVGYYWVRQYAPTPAQPDAWIVVVS
jgi:hypothetical protein